MEIINQPYFHFTRSVCNLPLEVSYDEIVTRDRHATDVTLTQGLHHKH